ncbi:uncharacterized protein PHACADRAFT_185867 [Phanerochaete carnosa HHB-10118-sp]|uniref:Uncharacterized protein n=1 Tax=Phanerochaete carnosa (strain HHB-10118-sp) TaxID=650164 RepID=K5UT62_PHACS|nr:uncharacterized protein PHACADRAFT_185867 [Phanerochaete carnosa HHB-10118-sp]EKM53141.1 hypothetical protein PHACADRAFT_185867 [Phanerochaete carnosa HHB-10118-sp]
MSSSSESLPATQEQCKVSFSPPSCSIIQQQSACVSKPQKKSKGKFKRSRKSSLEAKLGASTYLAGILNENIERDRERRRKADLEPLVELQIPDDFVYTLRTYAFELDSKVEEVLKQWMRKVCHIPDEDDLHYLTILVCALVVLWSVTGI